MINISDIELYTMEEIIRAAHIVKSNKKPSEWYESRMIMPPGDPFPGPVQFSRTPYWREPFDCVHPNHPALNITIVGPAQMGKSMMVLCAIIAWVISENPVNILFLTGHSKLSKEAMDKIDFVIKTCGLSHYITPNVLKKKNSKSGDTVDKKEYRGHDLKAGSVTNHNLLRQNTAQILISDDLDAGKLGKEETGSTIKLIGGRSKAFAGRDKKYWVSTPQVRGRSLIEIQWDKSDKRHWFVQCPHCGNSGVNYGEPDFRRIELKLPFKVTNSGQSIGVSGQDIEIGSSDMAGLYWRLDPLGRVDKKSVGYVCQICSKFFTDRDKHELLNSGLWIPTCEAAEFFHYGYGITGLYAPHGMTSWFDIASTYEACHPAGLPRKELEYQTFVNIDIGDWYEEQTEAPQAMELLKNCRSYPIGVVPESVSEADGNGDIILLAATFDCNGTVNDARIDYEIKAYSRAQPSYSVKFGSLGTFIPNQSAEQKANDSRVRYTYKRNSANSVWTLMDSIMSTPIPVDTGGYMRISAAAIDIGYLTDEVCEYIDNCNFPIVGVMGEKEYEYVLYQRGLKTFKPIPGRNKSWSLNVNMIKDDINGRMKLNWDKRRDKSQPHLYMNFPQYDYETFFKHYESEEKKEKEVGRVKKFMWQKKGPTVQNHQWDNGVYHIGLVDIFLDQLFKKPLKDNYSWANLSEWTPKRKRQAK